VAASVFFVPLACFSEHMNMLPSYYLKDGIEYQQTLLYIGALPSLRVALSAFFIGRGETRIITMSVAVGAVTDVVLDYILIFGVGHVIPKMGCRGAALATVIAELVQVLILAAVFFGGKHRKLHRTFENRRFRKDLFRRCLKVGIPSALGNFVSVLAWYVLQVLVSHVSKDAATVYNVGINLYIFFIFVGEGICKACAAICANMIGRNDPGSIEKTRLIFVKVSLAFGSVIAFPLVFFPEWVLGMLSLLPDDISNLYAEIRLMLVLLSATVVFETLQLATWGILIAGGDTKYSALVYQACLWGLVVLPSMILYFTNSLKSVPLLYFLMLLWTMSTLFLFHRRYRSMKWYNKLV
jgi:MATE family multidrug resistance protein